MLIVSYDFEKDKPRAQFSKFLKKFGDKMQYSVYEIKNSRRLLHNILKEIELSYKKSFKNTDSIVIFPICEQCQKNIVRYGSASHYKKDIVVFD